MDFILQIQEAGNMQLLFQSKRRALLQHMPDMLEEQQESPCAWSIVGERTTIEGEVKIKEQPLAVHGYILSETQIHFRL